MLKTGLYMKGFVGEGYWVCAVNHLFSYIVGVALIPVQK